MMFAVLKAEPLGQIFLANLKQVIEHNLIDRPLLENFLHDWQAAYNRLHPQPTTAKELINLIPSIPQFEQLYHFRHIDTPSLSGNVSTVIKWHFLRDWLNPELLNAAGISVDGDHFQEHFFQQLTGAAASHTGNLFDDTATHFGNPHNFMQFWITPSDRLDELRQTNPPDLADKARDLLGLVHHDSNIPLLELQFAADSVPQGHTATPSFIEAGDHRRFCTNQKPKSTQGWGLAVHLQDKAYTKPIPKGGLEAVAKAVPTSASLGRAIQPLGLTGKNAETANNAADKLKKDQEFAQLLWHNANIDAFVDFLPPL